MIRGRKVLQNISWNLCPIFQQSGVVSQGCWDSNLDSNDAVRSAVGVHGRLSTKRRSRLEQFVLPLLAIIITVPVTYIAFRRLQETGN